MSDKEYNQNNLQELTKSDYQIVGDEPNIIGWEVKNESNAYIGTVKELLFDPASQAVRYIIVELEGTGVLNEETSVAVPIGLARLHTENDEVTLPDIHTEQFRAWPKYNKESFGEEIEVLIRDVVGSPAALRMEQKIVAFDRNTFYNHHNFDRAMFQRNKNQPENSIDESSSKKIQENGENDPDTENGMPSKLY
ncbi:PRC-barrel domain-containing protein [Pedobacter jejuensis]|uniref:PRC-barrel domain containing protein n=1 Tax=Pedobacter jejuensis TaxID=1268550 RepID=A0A3N0BZ14_9SPHI|nr:PRC-barrel domain-containing protein [Pedobacter jejuensis]RNL54589.1 PRC-barrel domain containing protein [Pedobacter jejuensis]